MAETIAQFCTRNGFDKPFRPEVSKRLRAILAAPLPPGTLTASASPEGEK